jgi:hypothetical protein
MSNPDKKTTSHGHGGDTKPTPVPEHKTYGGGREDVAGGPAGRGNDTSPTTKTSRDWGRGDKQGEDEPAPVTPKEGGKNPFSP